jgi:hypothetical protein
MKGWSAWKKARFKYLERRSAGYTRIASIVAAAIWYVEIRMK